MYIILAIFISLSSAFNGPDQTDKFVVVIDPGHGGNDLGGRSDAQGLKEKNLTLKISQMLTEQFDDQYEIILTRNEDVSLTDKERIAFVDAKNPKLYISIHFGYQDEGKEYGMHSHFTNRDKYKEDSEYYAGFFLEEFIELDEMLPVRQPTAVDDQILSSISCPGVVLSLGSFENTTYNEFLSRDKNIAEMSYLIARAIRGIKDDY